MANNNALFNAAIAGIGGAIEQRWITGQSPVNYVRYQASLEAFATAVDAAIPAASPSQSDVDLLQSICMGVLANRDITSIISADYESIALSIAALYTELQASLEPTTTNVPPLSNVFYVDGGTETPLSAQTGSIAAPYSTITAAFARLASVDKLVLRVCPGNYSGEDRIVLTTDDFFAITSWVPGDSLTGSPNDARVILPAFTTTTSAHGFGAAPVFLNVDFAAECIFGTQIVYFHGCESINLGIDDAPRVFAKIYGGHLAVANVLNLQCTGTRIPSSGFTAVGDSKFIGCDTEGTQLTMTFAPDPAILYYDSVTKGNSANQTPGVTNGSAQWLGFPTQNITGTTEQEQIDSIVTALVNLGLGTDGR